MWLFRAFVLATTTESKSSGADRSDFFCPIDKILGSFFSLYSQAKQQRRKAVALLPRMKDRRPNTTLMLLLMSYGGLVSMLRQKKRLVFSSFFLSFFGLSTWIMICSKPLRDFSGEVEEQGGRRALMIRWYQTEGEKEEKRKESLFPFWLSDDLLPSFFFDF